MKNKIWRNWKMTGAALIMSCSLLMGSGSAVLGAELAESDIFLEDVEAMDPSGESETEQELDLAEVVDEIRTTEAAETLEITEIPEITEFPAATDAPPFIDSEEKDQTPSYKMWITPQQTQIKAGKELPADCFFGYSSGGNMGRSRRCRNSGKQPETGKAGNRDKKRILFFCTASRDTVGKDLPVSEWKCRI